jgi:hypothetical protein
MKQTRRGLFATALVAGTALAGCARTAPVQDGDGELLGRATLAQGADQIRAAGASLDWRIEAERPDLLRSSLLLRSHGAVVQMGCGTVR